MILSVIIVNYNVKTFLRNCLLSVKKSIGDISAEVFIIDNASSDGSVEALRPEFPEFIFIENNKNLGFAKANNQALALSKGEFVLFLNPDTLIPQDCFTQCISFMHTAPNAGAIGVRMVDGNNDFLKESKRGFPSPMVSFWKLTGITALFPRSKIFAEYYLGHLDEHQTHKVNILSGAFLFARKSALDITGGFDEQFFMYAEDIDLSHRIVKAGFDNYYYPSVTIVHFKGESTKKDLKYVKQFYLAMSQFAKKYYGRGLYTFFLDIAITLRALISTIIRK